MSALAFELPPVLEATAPAQARGVARDAVRLMIADGRDGSITHRRFHELTAVLDPGDLVVINVSRTLPAAVPGRRADGAPVCVHFSTRAPGLDERWRVVELRAPDGSRPERGCAGESIALDGGAVALELAAPYAAGSRLLLARLDTDVDFGTLLERLGAPIRYGYAGRSWPLDDYQNVYAITPGSAEMPSAGRPFTDRLLVRLMAAGITIAPVVLHAGVSSPEKHEPPTPERYTVPAPTARLVNGARAAGARVVAVGTTVVRALETAARQGGAVVPASGWTDLVLGPGRSARVVTGLVTGLHAPEASHLLLLEAVAGPALVGEAYQAAVQRRYLWHEFGDSTLFLP